MRDEPSELGHIERELDDTRSRLDATIGQLQHKLAPREVVDQAVAYFMEGGGVEFRNNLMRSIRDNPVPVAMIGAGIGWLMLANSRQGQHRWGSSEGRRSFDAGHDMYGRRTRTHSAGLSEEAAWRQAMPYEAAARDDLATQAEEAGRRVARREGEEESAFQERVHAARGAVLGLTREVGEAASSFRERVEEGVRAAAERVRSMAASAGSQASHLLDRGQSTARDLYGYGRSAASSMRHGAGDVAGGLAERPLLLGAIGVTVGAAIGMLVPPSRYERRLAGSVRESLRDSVREAAGEAGQRVARVAENVLDTARDSARREGFVDTDPESLAAGARERVADVASRARHVVEETAAAGRQSVEAELGGGGGSRDQASASPAGTTSVGQPGGNGGRRAHI